MTDTNQAVQKGSRVTFHFTLSFADGTEVEGTKSGEPLTVVIGDSDLLPSFENCLIGLKSGDKGRFEIACMDAFGPVDTDNVHVLPRKDFPIDMELAEGVIVGFALPDGREVAGTIVDLNELDVQVNFSHPLAGHDVVFSVAVVSVDTGPI